MYVDTIKSEGLAHISYLVGDGHEAVVIDPRRDIDIYVDSARTRNAVITHVIETHRHEDFVSGATALAEATGARHIHGRKLPFRHGDGVKQGETIKLGKVSLSILETPGHTPESISVVLRHHESGEAPFGVFTGDLLFVGASGRIDLVEDQEQAAREQYRSIQEKILPLGDDVLLWPAHGAGSVCGSGMAQRDFSTLGFEKRYNEELWMNEDDFVHKKLSAKEPHPPYFARMEELNLHGEDEAFHADIPTPLTPDDFERYRNAGMQVLDVRRPEAFAGAFVPGSIEMALAMVPGFAGYLLEYFRPIGIVCEDPEQARQASCYLQRMGFDNIRGFLAGGMIAWASAGKRYESVHAIEVRELSEKLERGDQHFRVLDVREHRELEETGTLPGATHVFLGDLPDHMDEVPRDVQVVTFCATGERAIIAASLLKRSGFRNVRVALGSMSACQAIGCRTEAVRAG